MSLFGFAETIHKYKHIRGWMNKVSLKYWVKQRLKQTHSSPRLRGEKETKIVKIMRKKSRKVEKAKSN